MTCLPPSEGSYRYLSCRTSDFSIRLRHTGMSRNGCSKNLSRLLRSTRCHAPLLRVTNGFVFYVGCVVSFTRQGGSSRVSNSVRQLPPRKRDYCARFSSALTSPEILPPAEPWRAEITFLAGDWSSAITSPISSSRDLMLTSCSREPSPT